MNTPPPNPASPEARDHPLNAPGVQEWERTYSMFLHLSLLLSHFAIPPVIAALVLWLMKREQSQFVDDHGKEAINFQLSMLCYAGAATVVGFLTCSVGWLFFIPIYALGLIGLILGAIAANKGRYFRYPACIRFIG